MGIDLDVSMVASAYYCDVLPLLHSIYGWKNFSVLDGFVCTS